MTRSARAPWRGWLAGAALSLAPAVAHAAPRPADDIRDIRPLILISPWWYWLAAGAAAFAVLGAIGAALLYWRRRSRRPLTPPERALAALTRAERMARDGHCRDWAALVAMTLREALASHLGVEGCPQTTNELAHINWSSVPHGETVDGEALVSLLSSCDVTRFALGQLETQALLAATDSAREWIHRLFAEPKPPVVVTAANPFPPTPANVATDEAA